MPNLFSEYPTLKSRNRIVMAPMTRCSCTDDGLPTPELAKYYINRAKNGVGLIIIEASSINAYDALGYLNGSQFHSSDHVNAWKPIVKKIHEHGAKVWIQLYHAGRLTVSSIAKRSALAPSAIAPFNTESFWRPKVDGKIVHFQTNTEFEKPEELTHEQIYSIIEQFNYEILRYSYV